LRSLRRLVTIRLLMNRTPARVDYANLYDGYWQRPDRFGEHSFSDPQVIVGEVLSAFGSGRMLDVGSGMGWLVRSLLGHGVDAYGLDVSKVAVQHCNEMAPGRFHEGSLLELPFPDQHFDVVVSTDCLEHISEADVPRALAELHRVARNGVYLRLATTPDRDGHWHLTVQKRAWWENQLFAAGFRKHPRAMAIVPYERLEEDGWQITLVMQRLTPAALHAHSLASLLAMRDLHMDMLRETGRRSDAHVARYHLAASFVRPNDVVVDVACGLGYGTAVLAANSEASQVIGVDLDVAAVRYADATTRPHWPQTEFRRGDATRLAFLADRSVDLIASFETLEHVPDPEALLAEFDRVLKPSGRVVVSVPHRWVDESGRDPNPHHLHVYDWPKLHTQLVRRFVPEAVWAQTAGGGMKLADAPRRIVRAPLADPTRTPAEWWLAVAMKSPVGAAATGYRETSFPCGAEQERPDVVAFARDYENPWLVKAMVVRGQRLTDDAVLGDLAERALRAASLERGRADVGAALCVLGYQLLADRSVTSARVDELLSRIDAYCAAETTNPNAFRWQLSLHYLVACLLRHCGKRRDAAARFRRCAQLDAGRYSALLGTKTVDALLQAGMIAAADGDLATARADWQRALLECERLLRGDWTPFLGSRDSPLSFGLREATELLDLGASVARALLDLPATQLRPGKVWEMAQLAMRPTVARLQRAIADIGQWNADLLRALETTRRALAQLRAATGQADAGQVADAAQPDDTNALEIARATIAERDRTIAEKDQLIERLQRMRGIKGTIRGLVDRLTS
jgi:ubiquinone/menaquinone biosynthesis C-methylase UbiE